MHILKEIEGMGVRNVLVEKKDNIATIIISRPQQSNTLSSQLLQELGSIVEDIRQDRETLAVIVTGEGEVFSSGIDYDELNEMSPEEARRFSHIGSRVFRSLELMEKPVIAAIDGIAYGGGFQLSLACDIRIASDRARFSMPEVGLGIIPGLGGTQRLRSIVGIGRAKELIFSGRQLSAPQAYEIGLISMLVDPKDLMREARSIASSIVRSSSFAMKLAKAAINLGVEVDMDTALGLEEELFAECFSPERRKCTAEQEG